MVALITLAFSNEIFGLVSHAMHAPWLYEGTPQLYVDLVAITAASALASKHSLHQNHKSMLRFVEDAFIPLGLAYAAPTISVPAITQAMQRTFPARAVTASIAAGMTVVLALSSLEARFVEDKRAYFGGLSTLAILIFLESIAVRDTTENHCQVPGEDRRLVPLALVAALFGVLLAWNATPRALRKYLEPLVLIGTIFVLSKVVALKVATPALRKS